MVDLITKLELSIYLVIIAYGLVDVPREVVGAAQTRHDRCLVVVVVGDGGDE